MGKFTKSVEENGFLYALLIYAIAQIICVIIGAFLWTYSINQWRIIFNNPPDFQWWQGALLGLIPYFGWFSVPLSVITLITSLII